MVLEPPPSRLKAVAAPARFMSRASWVVVTPAETFLQRPSTTHIYSVLLSAERPNEVLG
jgi:hypothetical protein